MATEGEDKASRLSLASAVVIVALAFSANAFFNHTALGLDLKSHGDVYVLGFFFPLGVILPAAHIGWVSSVRLASARWLGAQVGWRDVTAVAVALAGGGLLAAGALAPQLREPGSLAAAHRLFALLLVASTAEVLLFLGALGNAAQLAAGAIGRWRAGLVTLVVSSVTFGFFHLTYPAPWNTMGRCLGLCLVWVPVSLIFLFSRSLVAAVVLNNVLAVVGFVQNDLGAALFGQCICGSQSDHTEESRDAAEMCGSASGQIRPDDLGHAVVLIL